MPYAIVASGIALKDARRASAYLRRRNILSKISKDGIYSLFVWVPHTMSTEQTEAVVKTALGAPATSCQTINLGGAA